MVYGKRFNAYIKAFPMNDKPSANRCSALSYKELKTMAKSLYPNNYDAKDILYRYQNMPKDRLANAVYNALGTII